MSKYFVLETRGILTPDVLESLAERIQNEIMKSCRNFNSTLSSLPVITCAASLAHHGLLVSVKRLWLGNFNLTSEHLAALVSCVTQCVYIWYVSGYDLGTILDNIKCTKLGIFNLSLGSEETRALLQAMESRVEEVWLYDRVTLEIRVLMEYSGQGKCGSVGCYNDSVPRYREQLKTWVMSRNWTVTRDCDEYFVVRDCKQVSGIQGSSRPNCCSSDGLH